MNILHKKIVGLFFLLLLLISGCQDPWDDRTRINKDVPQSTIIEEILNKPELSEFAKLLQQTGWDSILASTKSYTVWAPTNDALALVGSEILSNQDETKSLVDNHICFLQYDYYSHNEPARVKNFKGKYLDLDFVSGTVNGINILEPDIVANNGVLHIINEPLIPLKTVWEFIESTSECPMVVNYLKSMTGTIFDPSIAVQIGVDPNSGKAIYDTATGLIWDNIFLNSTRDLRSEEIESTVILFSDVDYESEFAKFRPYFSVNQWPDDTRFVDDTAVSDSITKWMVLKDIVFPGKILPGELPSNLVSTFGVSVPVGSFTVKSSYEASNGIVYIIDNYSINKEDKIPVIIIEGEDTNKYVGRDPFGYSGFTRQVPLASGGADFVLDNHGGNPGTLTYYVPDLCYTKYNVYWKVVNDFDYSYKTPNAADSIKQSLGWVSVSYYEKGVPIFGNFSEIHDEIGSGGGYALYDTSYVTAPERFIKASSVNGYKRKEYIQISSATTLNGKYLAKNRTIAIDYIKLEPILDK